MLWLVTVALLGSFISLYYYLIVLKAVFVDEPVLSAARHANVVSADLLPRTIVAVLAAAVLLIGVAPQPLAAQILAAVP